MVPPRQINIIFSSLSGQAIVCPRLLESARGIYYWFCQSIKTHGASRESSGCKESKLDAVKRHFWSVLTPFSSKKISKFWGKNVHKSQSLDIPLPLLMLCDNNSTILTLQQQQQSSPGTAPVTTTTLSQLDKSAEQLQVMTPLKKSNRLRFKLPPIYTKNVCGACAVCVWSCVENATYRLSTDRVSEWRLVEKNAAV